MEEVGHSALRIRPLKSIQKCARIDPWWWPKGETAKGVHL